MGKDQSRWTADELQEKKELEGWVTQYGTWAAISRAKKVPISTLKSRGKKYGVASARAGRGAPKHQDPLTAAIEKSEEHHATREWEKDAGFVRDISRQPFPPEGSIPDEELIIGAGKDPKEWEVQKTKQSSWNQQSRDEGIITLYSFGVWFKRRDDYVDENAIPVTCGEPIIVKPEPRRPGNKRKKKELVAIMSDFHAPYHDEALLKTTLGVLSEIQPERVIINGDLMDFPDLSKHPKRTNACRATPAECLSSGRAILAAIRAAVPADTKVQFLSGNHDAWLHTFILNQAGPLADIPAPDGKGGDEDYPALSLRHLLQFKNLNIELVGSEENWLQSKIVLTPDVVVRHGIFSSDTTPIKAIIQNSVDTDYATISGHTHRAGTWPITRWKADPDDYERNEHRIVFGAEIGGMYKLPERETDWPTYVPHQMRWQPGWATVEIEDDKHYNIDLASWQNGVLMWRGQRY